MNPYCTIFSTKSYCHEIPAHVMIILKDHSYFFQDRNSFTELFKKSILKLLIIYVMENITMRKLLFILNLWIFEYLPKKKKKLFFLQVTTDVLCFEVVP